MTPLARALAALTLLTLALPAAAADTPWDVTLGGTVKGRIYGSSSRLSWHCGDEFKVLEATSTDWTKPVRYTHPMQNGVCDVIHNPDGVVLKSCKTDHGPVVTPMGKVVLDTGGASATVTDLAGNKRGSVSLGTIYDSKGHVRGSVGIRDMAFTTAIAMVAFFDPCL